MHSKASQKDLRCKLFFFFFSFLGFFSPEATVPSNTSNNICSLPSSRYPSFSTTCCLVAFLKQFFLPLLIPFLLLYLLHSPCIKQPKGTGMVQDFQSAGPVKVRHRCPVYISCIFKSASSCCFRNAWPQSIPFRHKQSSILRSTSLEVLST